MVNLVFYAIYLINKPPITATQLSVVSMYVGLKLVAYKLHPFKLPTMLAVLQHTYFCSQ